MTATILANKSIARYNVQEQDGAIVRLSERYIVKSTETDYEKVFEALTATGIPVEGDSIISVHAGASNLRAVRREAAIMESGHVEVLVHYETFGERRRVSDFETSATLQQISTEKDRFGNPLSVSHTYPDDDPQYGLETDFNPSTDTPKAFIEGGSISVQQPVTTSNIELILGADFPLHFQRFWMGAVNSRSWAGEPAFTWLVTNFAYRHHDISKSPVEYVFNIEVTHNPQGWTPTIIAIDPRTGRPPDGVVAGVGLVNVAFYRELSFQGLFPPSIGTP